MDEENKGEFSERPEVTPAESVILPVQKKSKVTTILCIVLAIAVIGLGTYILCDKVLNKEETKKEPDTAEKTEEEEKVECSCDIKINAPLVSEVKVDKSALYNFIEILSFEESLIYPKHYT